MCGNNKIFFEFFSAAIIIAFPPSSYYFGSFIPTQNRRATPLPGITENKKVRSFRPRAEIKSKMPGVAGSGLKIHNTFSISACKILAGIGNKGSAYCKKDHYRGDQKTVLRCIDMSKNLRCVDI